MPDLRFDEEENAEEGEEPTTTTAAAADREPSSSSSTVPPNGKAGHFSGGDDDDGGIAAKIRERRRRGGDGSSAAVPSSREASALGGGGGGGARGRIRRSPAAPVPSPGSPSVDHHLAAVSPSSPSSGSDAGSSATPREKGGGRVVSPREGVGAGGCGRSVAVPCTADGCTKKSRGGRFDGMCRAHFKERERRRRRRRRPPSAFSSSGSDVARRERGLCSVDGCETKSLGGRFNGMCLAHFYGRDVIPGGGRGGGEEGRSSERKRWEQSKRGGGMRSASAFPKKYAKRHARCSVVGCEKFSQGPQFDRMCMAHFKEGRDAVPGGRGEDESRSSCSSERQCEKRSSRGVKRGMEGQGRDTNKKRRKQKRCSADGCEKQAQGKPFDGMCIAHFRVMERGALPNAQSEEKSFSGAPSRPCAADGRRKRSRGRRCAVAGCEKFSQGGKFEWMCCGHFREVERRRSEGRERPRDREGRKRAAAVDLDGGGADDWGRNFVCEAEGGGPGPGVAPDGSCGAAGAGRAGSPGEVAAALLRRYDKPFLLDDEIRELLKTKYAFSSDEAFYDFERCEFRTCPMNLAAKRTQDGGSSMGLAWTLAGVGKARNDSEHHVCADENDRFDVRNPTSDSMMEILEDLASTLENVDKEKGSSIITDMEVEAQY